MQLDRMKQFVNVISQDSEFLQYFKIFFPKLSEAKI